MKLRIVHEHWPAGWVGRYSQKLTRWYELHMINKSVVAESNEDLYPKSLKATGEWIRQSLGRRYISTPY